MSHLIDKDAIVAEIKKRYEYWREKEHNSHSIESEIRMSECQHLMLLFNTIEAKEVDLGVEITLWANAIPEIRLDDIERLAIYFFELGLKAQKGEEI